MSQRTFIHESLSVFAGWDRPLQYFFVVVERVDANDDDDGYVFSNLRDRPPGRSGMTIEEIKIVLNQNNIVPPVTFYADLERDRINNDGTTIFNYGGS